MYNQYRVRKHNKTTQKHGNVCKNENKSLRTYQCIINTMSENTIKTIQSHAHVHPPKNQCALMHTRYHRINIISCNIISYKYIKYKYNII